MLQELVSMNSRTGTTSLWFYHDDGELGNTHSEFEQQEMTSILKWKFSWFAEKGFEKVESHFHYLCSVC